MKRAIVLSTLPLLAAAGTERSTMAPEGIRPPFGALTEIREPSRPLTQLVRSHIQFASYLGQRPALGPTVLHQSHGFLLELLRERPALTPRARLLPP